MASTKSKERTLSPSERKAMKFMGARLRDDERRYREFVETLEPRERERLALQEGLEQ